MRIRNKRVFGKSLSLEKLQYASGAGISTARFIVLLGLRPNVAYMGEMGEDESGKVLQEGSCGVLKFVFYLMSVLSKCGPSFPIFYHVTVLFLSHI